MHRDVKPANFLLSRTDDADEERVLLTDFGVAKSSDDGQDLTQTGQFMATVAYAPPEQLIGNSLDPRADIYSLGCSFFKLLTGQNPYPSTMPAVVMMGHLHEPPPKLSAVRPGLPLALDAVIEKVMAKNPADRYSTCREFIQAAEAALYGTPNFRAPDSGYSTDPRSPLAPPMTDPRQPVPTYSQQLREDTDQRLVSTLRNGRRPSRARRLLVPTIVAVVVAVAVAAARAPARRRPMRRRCRGARGA